MNSPPVQTPPTRFLVLWHDAIGNTRSPRQVFFVSPFGARWQDELVVLKDVTGGPKRLDHLKFSFLTCFFFGVLRASKQQHPVCLENGMSTLDDDWLVEFIQDYKTKLVEEKMELACSARLLATSRNRPQQVL